MTLIQITNDGLGKYTNNEINVGGLSLNFQRTCRVPSGEINSLPAGLGAFPMFKVSDFKSGCPKHWKEDSWFFPMYRQEAMWVNFNRLSRNPRAVIVAAGNVNAVSGKPFDLSKDLFGKKNGRKEGELKIELEKKQNYLVVPPQPWIDGWKAEDGKIYQFVAAELGSGETVEGQITGEETVGGIQLIVFGPKPGQNLIPKTRPHEYISGGSWSYSTLGGSFDGNMIMACCASVPSSKSVVRRGSDRGLERLASSVRDMGLGKGGEIEQKIYPDPYGLKVWNDVPAGSVRIHLVSSEDFKQITGYNAPETPVTYAKYQELGLPWFDLYDSKYKDTKGNSVFDKLKEVGEGKAKQENGKKQQDSKKEDKDWLIKFE
jgi:hypothetical protein